MILNVNSTYNPLSFQDIAAPFLLYKQAYDQAEKDMTSLSQQTDMWKNLINKETNPIAAKMYQDYANKLNTAVEDFSQGMTMQNRGALLGLKKDYASAITPIINAYKRVLQLKDNVTKLNSTNPYLMFENNPNNITIDALIKDPEYNIGNTVDGSLIYKQVHDLASAYAKSIEEGDLKSLENLPYKVDLKRFTGLTSNEIKQQLLQDDSFLNSIIDKSIEGSGFTNWKSIYDENHQLNDYGRNVYSRLRGMGELGAMGALGSYTHQIVSDDYGQNVALETLKAKFDMEKQALANAQNNTTPTTESLGNLDTVDIMLGDTAVAGGDKSSIENDLKALNLNYYPNQGHMVTTNNLIKLKEPDEIMHMHSPTAGFSSSDIKKHGWITVRYFDKNKNLLTKQAFVAQGKTKHQKKFLAEKYDTVLKPAMTRLTANSHVVGNTLNRIQNTIAYHKNEALGNYKITGITYNPTKRKETISRILSSSSVIKIEKGNNKGEIQINGENGKPILMSAKEKQRLLNGLTTTKEDKKINENSIQLFILAGDKQHSSNQGILLQYKDAKNKTQTYLVQPKSISNNVEAAYNEYLNNYNKAEEYVGKNPEFKNATAAEKQQYINNTIAQYQRAIYNTINNAYGEVNTSTDKTYDND